MRRFLVVYTMEFPTSGIHYIKRMKIQVTSRYSMVYHQKALHDYFNHVIEFMISALDSGAMPQGKQ